MQASDLMEYAGNPNHPPGMSIGRNIALLRRTLGWNQTQLAKAAGTSQSNISRYETGERSPSDEGTLDAIARALGVTPDVLLTLDNSSSGSALNASVPSNNNAMGERTLPLKGRPQPEPDGHLLMSVNELASGTVRCPIDLLDARDAYAVPVNGDAIRPAAMSGDLAFVHPTHPLAKGRPCLVVLKDDRAYIRLFEGRTASELIVSQPNPPQEHRHHVSEVRSVQRIIAFWPRG